ncbi:GIY-YIG nuclease family protein [Streptomyces kaempferi]|uniref:GIY-YIG nuclease family protein n=1 Tax=Streptomyces kaempferi TaxID=333725 RepID=A0ABW3XL16_9ACTN
MTGADRTALYRLYDEAGQLLYVGITTYPPKRFVEHERDKPWWSQVVRRDVEWVESRVKAETAERCAIAAEQPRYNRIHNIGRPIAAGPSPEAAEVFARFKGHYEARRGLEPEMLESADRALKAGATVGQLAAWTGLTPEVFRRRARALGVERKRPPTVGKLAPERPANSEEKSA